MDVNDDFTQAPRWRLFETSEIGFYLNQEWYVVNYADAPAPGRLWFSLLHTRSDCGIIDAMGPSGVLWRSAVGVQTIWSEPQKT